MRVTQSMLSSNMLRNLNTNYNKMSKIQDQMNSGKLINRPSDDPVIAVKGMGYRVDLDKNVQYQRNMREAHTWLDSTDEALDQVGTVLIRMKELIVQAANDTNTQEDRTKIQNEIKQIKEHVQDLGNTRVGESYIFSGTHTNQPLFKDGEINAGAEFTPDGSKNNVNINVFDGITMQVNTTGVGLFDDINQFLTKVDTVFQGTPGPPPVYPTGKEIGDLLGVSGSGSGAKVEYLDRATEKVLEVRATVGARQNRLELMENRLEIQEINVTKQMSLNEDTDYAKTITQMVAAESIHQASLSVGAKIIQQTLVDFMR